MTVFNGTPTNDSLPGAGQDFSGDNTIRGLAGNDTINAGTGNDIVEGGAGNDWLDGGAGRDTADYSYVTVNMAATLQAEGQTTTISISTVTGAEDIDRLTNIENLAGGLGNDSLTGNDAANVLSGGSGNDTLSGGAGGQDTLIGGTGIDTAVFVGGAVVVALDRHGNATASGGDTDVLVGIENLTGSASGSDRLSGNASDNVLIGLGGNDVLLGGGGNDTIVGGGGTDTLIGGAGTDHVSFAGLQSGVTADLNAGTARSTRPGNNNTTVVVSTTINEFEGIVGSSFADSLTGLAAAASTLDGGEGDDTLAGGSAADSLIGGDGVDFASYAGTTAVSVNFSSAGSGRAVRAGVEDTLDGIEGVIGSSGHDTLNGSSGDEIFRGGHGNDIIAGDGGIDTADYSYTNENVTIELDSAGGATAIAGAGDIDTLSGIENLIGGRGNDVLTGNALANRLEGGDGGDNTLIGGLGNDTLVAGGRHNLLEGGAGNDTLLRGNSESALAVYNFAANTTVAFVMNSVGAATFNAGALGTDTLVGIDRLRFDNATGVTVRLDITGDAANNLIIADRSVSGDVLRGEAGDDTLDGGSGADSLFGGSGNDRLLGRDGANRLEGGEGTDIADFSHLTVALTHSLNSTSGSLNTAGGNNTLVSIEGLAGGSGADSLSASTTGSVANWFEGNTGNDTLRGLGGNDTLFGGADNDTINGEGGNDTVEYTGDWNDYSITVGEDGAFDIVDRRGIDGIDRVTNVETFKFADKSVSSSQLVNAAPDATITWTATGLKNITAPNTIWESIAVGKVDEKLTTNLHIATVNVTDANGVGSNISQTHTFELTDADGNAVHNSNFFFATGDNANRLFLSSSHTLDAEDAGTVTLHIKVTDAGRASKVVPLVINVKDYSGSFLDAKGDTGTSEEDSITGTAGNDSLIGRGGDDTISGGAGNDTIHGEDANWTGTGADSISGGDGNDFISGGRGNDTMDGGAGNDTLSYTGETRDVLITYTATATGAPTLGATITGGEVDVIRGFEAFRGGSGNDTFRLEKSINADLDLPALYFDGGAGQNTLDLSGLFAGLAQGSIAGGKTTIRLANSSQQTILETTGLNARAERLTVDNIQNLVGTSFDDDVTGTAGANRIDGGAGNDTIRGEGGADTLIGGTGDDVFYIASPDAIIVEVSGEGTDTVFANTTFFRLGSNVENLTLSKGGVAIGSDVANQITGSSSADTLEGGAGADTINGGFGNDFATYRSSSNGVVVTLRDDTVQVAQIGGDAQGDVLISIEHLEGSAFSDILTGNKGANILVGGAGNDVLDGGAGNDWADYRSATTGVQIDLRRDVQVGGDAQGDVFISIEGIRGSAFNDTLIGNDADNLFDGAAGADAINGLGGIDTVTYATSAAGVKVSLRGGQTGSGGDAEGDTWFNIENVIGSSHADSFESGSERGVVYFFDGGNGQDVITFENAGSGATVNLSITAEQRTGTGNGQVRLNDIEGAIGSNFGDSLTGNASGNALSGGAGHDTLVGGGGEDTLTGGTGNDVLTGDGLNLRTEQYRQDTFVFVAGGGNDTIADFGLGTGVQARDKLDFKAFGWTAGDLRLTTDNTAGLTEAAFNADNNIKIALIQRTSLTEDWRFMYRDGESTATLTIKHANQNIVWSATDHFIFT